MSGPMLSGDKIPENLPEKTKRWLENHKPLWKTSPFDIPGPCYFNASFEPIWDLLDEMSRKYDVDEEEILIGKSDVPPSDPTCLVYLRVYGIAFEEYFRKNLKSDGRWVNENYLHHIFGTKDQEGTYDYRYGIAYKRRGTEEASEFGCSYLHMAYANSPDGTVDFSITERSGRTYVGTYEDFNPADSQDPGRYQWVKTVIGQPL